MSKPKEEYSEMDHIRQDIESLKSNIVELTKHLSANASARTDDLKLATAAQLKRLKDSGLEQVSKVEGEVVKHPAQSIAIAFATGFVASYLLSRR